ncbi:Stage 0 sporulation protein A [Planctomycetes bacterium Pan216]|uniref:Stage 0 sporulation protein A n=1 Tax=Kolteria novifilia TaxID=2527975 RepID=A0A518BBS4_9BACT|nr:Stage 0 sporulation protein A [Planctomycetes bacterium Pan216]
MANVLVIDDNWSVCEMIEAMLDPDHEVTTCFDGTRGLRLYEEGDYDLVITDLMMPGLTGLEVMRSIREREPGAKVLTISGGKDLPIGTALLKCAELHGADATLEKPFRRNDLVHRVDQVLASTFGQISSAHPADDGASSGCVDSHPDTAV